MEQPIEPARETAAFDVEYEWIMKLLGVSLSVHKLDDHFSVVWANPYYYEMFGYTKEEYEATFHNCCDLFFVGHPELDEDWNHICEVVFKATEEKRSSYSYIARMPLKDGRLRWVRTTGYFTDESVDGVPIAYSAMTFVDELMETQQMLLDKSDELEQLAFVDPVTGGANRTRFEMCAASLLDGDDADGYSFVSLDIEKFKLLNDMFGIEHGDRTLRYVYNCMAEQLHDDEVACRLSGDSFNLLLKEVEEDRIVQRLEDFATRINAYNADLDDPYLLTFTAGAYAVTDRTLPITTLRDRANVARKKVKTRRGSVRDRLCTCSFYSDGDRLALMREKDIENRMRDALANGDFVAYLQPKIRLDDGSIAGAEALARWNDPAEGVVPPSDFIPLFERNGFVVELDLYVFESVCRLMRRWLDDGRSPVPVSVNMSRVHLQDPRFLDRYEEIRKRHDVPLEYLELEVTETAAIDDPEAFMAAIEQLHEGGYTCSMDDFGSGYSSLNVLKDIDVDVLKLDRAFFINADTDRGRKWSVISSVLSLAREFEMETVAEGVDTLEQLEKLRLTSCDLVQGYIFHRPMPVEEFEALLFGSEAAPNRTIS